MRSVNDEPKYKLELDSDEEVEEYLLFLSWTDVTSAAAAITMLVLLFWWWLW